LSTEYCPLWDGHSGEGIALRGVILVSAINQPAKTLAARRPMAQHAGDQHCSRGAANSNHRQMTTVLEAVNGRR
jgi:hypothetical protein